ncbi:MAG: helix-turn-helix domain-containing protein [Ilumatobacter sp.]|uniref:helix-turn-helix domain-containing protein n=1 Tax=Ilumatobacter sp. TaxID=1967498 RepID=UPI003919E8F6
MDGIDNREWLEAQLERNVSITNIADVAGVSRQTVYAWIERHKLRPVRSQRVRPPPDELARLYDRCRTTRELGEQLGVAPETARRWLIDADIERRRARLDTGEVRAKRLAGATIAQLAIDHGVGNDTIRRRLDPSWGE